ncbi:class I SAM-dependent RNA methyltransferase [Plantibacter sp. Leaf314]|uniref:class I SAM-dependent RNA methyltransferase n=1 Tax=Plantibacter sp. Leaf314 TaxID=1736333 RepID=UPI0006FE0727|nr:TRAM domain-containing protein [Plantibacter sp. Leaf314]KQQ50406.1 23S rRNA methyltransferase [Plantibacter sp. Leaf314]
MSTTTGRTVELDITNVAHGGVFVARHEGRVVFVPDTLPGERVRARIVDENEKRFWRAETLEVLTPSEYRRPHVWAEASVDREPGERAGGAEFGHIDLAHQRALKHQVLAEGLERFAGVAPEFTVSAVDGETPDGTRWRTRVSLHVDQHGNIGPYAARSHQVVPVDDLPLAIEAVADAARLEELPHGTTSIDIVASSTGAVRVLTRADEAGGGDRRRGGGRGRRGGPKPVRPAADPIRELVGDREFIVDANGFWQVHRQAATTLQQAVSDAIDDARFDARAANLDLYGGVGLLAAGVADRFGSTTRITTVESDERATEYAGENLSEWVGAQAVTAKVDAFLRSEIASGSRIERSRYATATVVLDPPRSGAGAEIVAMLGELRPASIVYVACDPIALSRDVALLAEQGYELGHLAAYDLFPNTHHLEAVAGFTRTA